MRRRGKVAAVREQSLGTELAEDAIGGALAVTVADVGAVDWDGGQIAVGFDVRNYTVAAAADPTSDEIDADDPPDPEEGVLDLDVGLTNSYPAETPVQLWPLVYEKLAYVDVEGERDVVRARLRDPLGDRIETGTRSAATAETVDLAFEDGEWVVVDLVGERAPGRSTADATNDGPVNVSTTDELNPVVLCSVTVDIPTDTHRVQVSYFAQLQGDTLASITLGFDDKGIDFPVGEIELASHSDVASSGPHDALPLLPLQPQDTAYVRAGAVAATADLKAVPTFFAPYTLDQPTPGLHTFRLVAWVDGGVGVVTNARLWVTVTGS